LKITSGLSVRTDKGDGEDVEREKRAQQELVDVTMKSEREVQTYQCLSARRFHRSQGLLSMHSIQI
jgi:hypothetical protein